MNRLRLFGLTSVAALGMALLPEAAESCSRILWNTNKFAVVVARTMDWPESTEPELVVFPRGIERDGARANGELIVKENAAKWTSKYGSVITSIYGIGSIDGMNEKGLAFHLLYLNEADFGARDVSKPGIQAALWGQYLIDNAATVDEALKLQEKIQIVMVSARGHQANVHLAIEDASGDSAIVEYINGKPVVHHGREYQIMTNSPTYDEQLALLKKVDVAKLDSNSPLPGNVNAVDRFQRAAYFAKNLPEPKNEREAIAGVLAIARNVSVPFGTPYKGWGVYNTEYRTVVDLTHKRYFFELTTNPSIVWIDLAKLDLNPGAPIKTIDPDNIDLAGDITGKLKVVEKAPF
ncbi:linear amide C-N hydrolase [Planctomicrobium sp. SH527]|uniref:linear amide C-N hydrolase n=1 Tax=Planctomicrobium sp. SH527 TaxID=3448123 RepID=UPI003F5C0BCD